MVLIDTPPLSLWFRRNAAVLNSDELRIRSEVMRLLDDFEVPLLGLVRQELLSGIRDRAVFDEIAEALRSTPDIPLAVGDYERAAACSNQCRAHGIACSLPDMLICSVALRNEWPIFTQDKDFLRYARVLPIKLHATA